MARRRLPRWGLLCSKYPCVQPTSSPNQDSSHIVYILGCHAICSIDCIMILTINLNKRAARFILMLAAAAVCALLGALSLQQVFTGMLTDERVAVPRQWLAAGLPYAPNSARLLARLA